VAFNVNGKALLTSVTASTMGMLLNKWDKIIFYLSKVIVDMHNLEIP